MTNDQMMTIIVAIGIPMFFGFLTINSNIKSIERNLDRKDSKYEIRIEELSKRNDKFYQAILDFFRERK